MCNTFRVDFLSDCGIISQTPLYRIPFSYVISSLKVQYGHRLWGSLWTLGAILHVLSWPIVVVGGLWLWPHIILLISHCLLGLFGLVGGLGFSQHCSDWSYSLETLGLMALHSLEHLLWYFLCLWGILCAHHIVPVWVTVSAVLDLKLLQSSSRCLWQVDGWSPLWLSFQMCSGAVFQVQRLHLRVLFLCWSIFSQSQSRFWMHRLWVGLPGVRLHQVQS